jgi:hypothetical protein
MVTLIHKKKKEDNSITMRVHKDFHKLVMGFMQDYYEKNSIVISTLEATKKINDKILLQLGDAGWINY